MSTLKFTDLQLEPTLQQSIDKLGYSDCTPIQAAVMPHIIEGKDVAGLAQTGTGKTAAFLIPLMDRILRAKNSSGTEVTGEQKQRSFGEWKAGQFILVLVPTRELAEQVYENIQKLSEFSGLKGYPIYGGTGYDKQKEALKAGLDFVVATPGRLIDLYKENFVDLKQVRAIVFDEADRMFDMGFKDDMKYVLSRVPEKRQFLVFSATLNFDVLNTAYQFGAEPVEVDVSRDQAKAENVKDELFHVGHDEKPKYLLSLLKKVNPKQAIIFSNFKHNVERIAKFLNNNGIPAMAISSLITQAQRNRVLEQFKAENDQNILVATDVAARGLDIKGVDLVINYELPNDSETYVHRIGRTGRAGAEGRAFSFASDMDVEALARIEDYLKHKINIGWMEDTEFITEFQPFPRDFENRGPRGPERRDRNDRNDRGPRGPRQGSDRPQRGDRGPRQDRPERSARPQQSQQRPQRDQQHQARGPRQDRPERSARPQQSQQRPQHGQPRPQGQHQNGRLHQKPRHGHAHHAHRRHRQPVVVQKGLLAQIKKFFTGLFGKSKSN